MWSLKSCGNLGSAEIVVANKGDNKASNTDGIRTLGNSPEPLNTHELILWPAPQRNNPRVNSLSTTAAIGYRDVN
jgi:hypothetical protein